MADPTVAVDLKVNFRSIDETGHIWTWLTDAPDPSVIWPGAIVVVGDERAIAMGRIIALVGHKNGTAVRVEILPGPVQPDRRRSRWSTLKAGWRLYLGIGAFLSVLFVILGAPDRIEDACNDLNIPFCQRDYAIMAYLSNDVSTPPSAAPESMEVFGIPEGVSAETVNAMFPPGTEIITAPRSVDGLADRTWSWRGVAFSADIELATGSVVHPFSISVDDDSEWIVAAPNGVLLGVTTLGELELNQIDDNYYSVIGSEWIDGFTMFNLQRHVPVIDSTMIEGYGVTPGDPGGSLEPRT